MQTAGDDDDEVCVCDFGARKRGWSVLVSLSLSLELGKKWAWKTEVQSWWRAGKEAAMMPMFGSRRARSATGVLYPWFGGGGGG